MDLFNPNLPILHSRDDLQRPEPLPELRIRQLTQRSDILEVRSSSSDCQSGDSSCSKNINTSSTVPIVIGVAIPCMIAAIILFVLQRRHSKIQRKEDAEDKYKSLDFGVDASAIPSKRKKKGPPLPEMSIADLKGQLRKDRGLSLDLGQSNPYLLPPELHQSRESLHSLSRSMNTGDDKYRATNFIPDDGSLRSPSIRSGRDDASTYTASTRPRFDSESRTELLSRRGRDGSEPPPIQRPAPVAQPNNSGLLAPQLTEADRYSTVSAASSQGAMNALRASNNYLGAYIRGGTKEDDGKEVVSNSTTVQVQEVIVTPPAVEPQELPAPAAIAEPSKRASSFYGNAPEVVPSHQQEYRQEYHQSLQYEPDPNLPAFKFADDPEPVEPQHQPQPQPQSEQEQHSYPEFYEDQTSHEPTLPNIQVHPYQDDDEASDYYDEELEDYQNYLSYTYRGSMVGARPLPPDDPSENPEQRANRIRSFYKEYFEETSKPGRQVSYYDGSENYMDDVYGYYESSAPHSRGPSFRSDGRHRAMSHGTYMGGPRAYSSMSGRMGPRQRMAPKKKLPPPKPLMTLPTPHKLKDDDFLPNAIDYAPPQLFKSQRAGTPTNPRGELRPYSPSVRAHVPLTSSFDDLAVIPSPHSLRKSGTFTGLDFAPPRRFKEDGTMSETGSIRSNKSGISALHQHNIRAGAYRVSRIPKEVAGTRDDMYAALKPKWDMRGDSAIPGMA